MISLAEYRTLAVFFLFAATSAFAIELDLNLGENYADHLKRRRILAPRPRPQLPPRATPEEPEVRRAEPVRRGGAFPRTASPGVSIGEVAFRPPLSNSSGPDIVLLHGIYAGASYRTCNELRPLLDQAPARLNRRSSGARANPRSP